jgi:hypothetical protein
MSMSIRMKKTTRRPSRTDGLAWATGLLLLAISAPSPAAADPLAIEDAVGRIAARSLWPGFEPATIPLAIFDGEKTYLFRHFKPPEGFEPVPGRARTSVYAGRFPAVTANTSVEIGGRTCATLMPATAAQETEEAAAVAIHEAFHVFQRKEHPAWSANEFDLLVYPFDDSEVLALRILETKALQRALEREGKTTCWASVARETRRDRFREMPAEAAAYERRSELNEGLARYVQNQAAGQAPDTSTTFLPEEMRARTYWTGSVLGAILDRLDPDWKKRLEEDDDKSLDTLLANAVAAKPPPAPCTFSVAEKAAAKAAADAAVEQLRDRRRQRRSELLDGEGWTLVFEAPDKPFQSAGFDPWNVLVMGGGEILHERYLKLQAGEDTIEILDHPSFTEGAGEHPLTQGVRKLVVPALASQPQVRSEGEAVTIEAEGISGRFEPARTAISGKRIFVRLGKQVPAVPEGPVGALPTAPTPDRPKGEPNG